MSKDSKKHKKGKIKNLHTIIRKPFCYFRSVIREGKTIRWCSFRKWMASGFTVLVLGSLIAGILTGFDIISSFIVISFSHMPKTYQNTGFIIIFILCIILTPVCYMMSLRGEDILKGLAVSNTRLFENSKIDSGDRRVTIFIWIMTAVLFLLLMTV